MKVLISAYACEPGAGSEPGAGWTWARAAAQKHDVWLLTRSNNASKIDAALAEEPGLRITPEYLELPRWARFWKRGPRGVHLYYLLWQRLARRAAARLNRRQQFDVAHHLTFAVDWLPAGVVGVDGLPSIWGPVGGAAGPPWVFRRWLGWRGTVQEAVREVVTRAMRRTVGQGIARRADLIVAQNHDVATEFSGRQTRVIVEPNPALDVEALLSLKGTLSAQVNTNRRAVFVGRLIPLKGLTMSVAAMAHATAHDWELHVFGKGPERARAERLAAQHGIADRVVFHGQQPRSEVLRALKDGDALLFPSIHDSAGWAVAEAVTFGTPVVCLNRGGPPAVAPGATMIDVNSSKDDVPALIASALSKVGPHGETDGRWSTDRLPALLDHWYRVATEDVHAPVVGVPQ